MIGQKAKIRFFFLLSRNSTLQSKRQESIHCYYSSIFDSKAQYQKTREYVYMSRLVNKTKYHNNNSILFFKINTLTVV
jgi:hypothetical protein